MPNDVMGFPESVRPDYTRILRSAPALAGQPPNATVAGPLWNVQSLSRTSQTATSR